MKASRRKIETFFFSFIFILSLILYLHLLFGGILTDITGHIIFSIMYNNGVNMAFPHPLFAKLLGLMASLCDMLNANRLAEILDLPIYRMLNDFITAATSIASVYNIDILSLRLEIPHLVNLHIAAALLMALLITLNSIILYSLYRYLLKDYSPLKSLAIMLTTVSIIVTPIYMPFFNKKLYLGQGSPNVWHNPTYILMKSFSYVVFFLIARTFTESSRRWASLALASAVIVLSAIAKPSFVVVFLPAVALYSLFRNPRDIKMHARLLLACLPVVGFITYQYSISFSDTDSRVIFDFLGVWRIWSPFIPVSIMLALAFPLSVIMLRPINRDQGNTYLVLAWTMLLISMFQVATLAESGPRYAHGNFFWGYNISQDLLFIFSLIVFARWVSSALGPDRGVPLKSRISSAFDAMSKRDAIAFAMCLTTLALHFTSGLYYLTIIYMMGPFPSIWHLK